MKKLLLSIVLATTTLVGYSQNTNGFDYITSPIYDVFSHTNVAIALFGERDMTDDTYGGGVAFGYKLTPFVMPVVRVDFLQDRNGNVQVFQPQFNLQLQVPITIANKVIVTPLGFTGVAIPLSGRGDNNLDPVFVIGTGAAIHLKDKKWGIVGDYEHWSGGGYNNNQIRVGPYWTF